MFEIVFEDERYRVRMDKDTRRFTICFKISRSIYADEGEGIELSYAEWDDLVSVVQRTKKHLQNLSPKDIRKGNISVHWLTDRLRLTIGEQFDDYFYHSPYIAFANLMENADRKIKEGGHEERY